MGYLSRQSVKRRDRGRERVTELTVLVLISLMDILMKKKNTEMH